MVLQRIKIKKRQNGKPNMPGPVKIWQSGKDRILSGISLSPQFSFMYADLKRLSMQNNDFIAESQAGSKKAKFILPAFAVVFKRVFTLFLVLMVILSQTIFVAGFEAHIVNVTANICNYSETRTIGYWKNHSETYKHLLPQVLGEESIDTVTEAEDIFNFSGDASDMRNKLEAQLLGMKFNIYYYRIGQYFVDSEGKTLFEIVADADALLLDQDATKKELENMKSLLDDLNNLHQLKFCPKGVIINEFLPNPAGSDSAVKKNGEWVELYNTGDTEVDLKGWVFYDLHDENELLITKLNIDAKSTIIKPKGFLIVYRNGNAEFNLNNTFGDAIRLYNNTIDKGSLMDIYAYTVDAPEGKSFALVPDGSTNWVDPIPTPGEPNSIEGEDVEFGPALSELGEDTDVLNTDIEIIIETPVQSSEIIPPDDPALSQSDINSNSAADNAAGSSGSGINDPTEITNDGTVLPMENSTPDAILTDINVIPTTDPYLPTPTPEAVAPEDDILVENIILDPTPSPEAELSLIEEIIPSPSLSPLPSLSPAPSPILTPESTPVPEQASAPINPPLIIESTQTPEPSPISEQTSPPGSTPASEPGETLVLEATTVALPDPLPEILPESPPSPTVDDPPDSDLVVISGSAIDTSVPAIEK